jgi:hypothetical protein
MLPMVLISRLFVATFFLLIQITLICNVGKNGKRRFIKGWYALHEFYPIWFGAWLKYSTYNPPMRFIIHRSTFIFQH